MHLSLSPTLPVLLLATGLLAQPNYTVTPRGVDLVECNSSTAIAINWVNATTRIQQADIAHLGTPRLIRSMSWRRNGTAATTATLTTNLDLLVAHADYTNFSTTFASNYKTTPVKVHGGNLQLDWTKASPLPVGLWSDVTIPFTTPFVYNGQDAFMWESQNFSNFTASSGYSLDWASGSGPTTRTSLIPEVLGTGCTTPNGAMGLAADFTVDATPGFRLNWHITNASGNVPVRLYIGIKNPGIPLFCGKLHTDALLFLPLGNSNASGTVTQPLTGSWTPPMLGFLFSAQAIAIDSNAPFGGYLSNGLFLRLPKADGSTPLAVKRIYSTSSATATTSTSAVTVSVQVTRLD